MRLPVTGVHIAVVLGAAALVALTVSRVGYGQGQTTPAVQRPIVWPDCQPFQQALTFNIFSGTPGSTGQIRIASGVTLTIEQVALRVDVFDDFLTPVVAAVTTSLRSNVSTYYLPIRSDLPSVMPARPLTLMQPGPLYADGGTDVTFAVTIDPHSGSGSGRAEWSISGRSCPL